MDSSNPPKSDPSLLLLNEIEILLAQTRLLELYAKQSRAAAAYETACLREQHQAELVALRVAVADQERIVAARQTVLGAAEQNLRERVQSLEHELAESRRRLLEQQAELQSANLEAANLRERIGQLEAAVDQARLEAREAAIARTEFEPEIVALRNRLAESQQVFHDEQRIWREIESNARNQIARRDEQLQETVTRFHAAESELREARGEIAQLHERIDQLQASGRTSDARAVQELEAARSGFAADLGRLQAALAEREHALEEKQRAAIEIERALRAEIITLRNQLDQQLELIGFRNEELRDAQNHLAALQQRAAELEAANQSALADAEEITRLRHHHENQLAALQHEVAVRERALTERQEAVTAVELALHGKIQHLQQELARGRNLTAERDSELQAARAESEALRQTIDRLEAKAAADEAARQLAEQTQSRLEAETANLQAQNADIEQARGEQERARIRAEEEIVRLRLAKASIEKQRAETESFGQELERSRQESAALKEELESRLRSKEHDLQSALESADATRSRFDTKITQLQLQLAEKQLVADSRATEIHGLKAEIDRLTEQLTQSNSAAAELRDGWQQQLDAKRIEHEAQIAALRNEYQLKQQDLEDGRAEERQRSAEYQRQVESLGQGSANLEGELEKRSRELETAAAKITALRSHLDNVEEQRRRDLAAVQVSEQARLSLDAELSGARRELQENASAIAQHQATLANMALEHRNEIQTLEARIVQQQQSVKDRNAEIEGSRAQARLLEQRIEELAAERRPAEQTAIDRAERITEEHTVRMADLEKQLEQKTNEMLQRAAAQTEHESGLRREIDRLVHESSERNQILQNRNEELVRVKADLDMFQEQYRALESATTQNEAALSADSERMRTEFQAQLALLQAELSQKEWAIEERQALLHGLEQNHRQEIDSLRQRLAELEKNGTNERDFVLGDAALGQEANFENKDGTQQRRWHTGFGWKRRWKSSETE